MGLGTEFVAEFPAPPDARWDNYSLVWESCHDGRLFKISCSALWDGELGDKLLAARVGVPSEPQYVDIDRRQDPSFGLGRRLRYVLGTDRIDAVVIVVEDSLFVASVQARADDPSKVASERFLDSFTVSPDARCPATKLVRVDEDRPGGTPARCGHRRRQVMALGQSGSAVILGSHR